MFLTHRQYFLVLTGLFAILWMALAISPLYRSDWLLENVLVFAFALSLALSWRWFTFSRISATLIFLFLCLHEVGAHYTYSQVPYDAWIESLTGYSLNEAMGWQRNHFDRFVHFAYGLLITYPLRELLLHVTHDRGVWSYLLPLSLTMATSLTYELIEWAAAVLFGGELGMAYLGTQGDVWDAHRDSALATLGAALSLAMTAAFNRVRQRDFAAEWVDERRA